MVEVRYFIVLPDQIGENKFILTPANDVLALTDFNTCYPVGGFEYEGQQHIIIRAVVPIDFAIVMAENISPEAFDPETGSPLTIKALDELGITHLYGGITKEELFYIVQQRFGIDISGERQIGVDEDGNPEFAPWIISHRFPGEM